MIRYKSNKQALVMTALVILLCLVCLTGATLALFTSDPNDGTIGIITTAGNVKIDIVDLSGDSLEDKTLQFQTSLEGAELLFEPGATFYTQGFKVKNGGNIPVNFRVSVSEDDEIDMSEFHEAFEVWISTDPTDLDSAEPLKPFIGRLEAEGDKSISDTYYLVVKMKESAGNEFEGKTYTGIGITVYAVQGNVDVKETS